MRTFDTYTRNILRFGALAIALAVLVAPAAAQIQNRFEVHVPFAFMAGKAKLPAGDYSVNRQGANLLILRNTETSDAAILPTASLDVDATTSRAALVFNRYEGKYFLSQVRSFDGTQTYRLAPSKEERELAVINVPTLVAVHTRAR
jgi:hypothetical protein